MAGHMQHGFYSLYDRANDLCWIACFASVLVLSYRMNAKRRVLFLTGSFVFLVLRIPLGSLGGGGLLIELPLLIAMGICAINYAIQPERCERVCEANDRQMVDN